MPDLEALIDRLENKIFTAEIKNQQTVTLKSNFETSITIFVPILEGNYRELPGVNKEPFPKATTISIYGCSKAETIDLFDDTQPKKLIQSWPNNRNNKIDQFDSFITSETEFLINVTNSVLAKLYVVELSYDLIVALIVLESLIQGLFYKKVF